MTTILVGTLGAVLAIVMWTHAGCDLVFGETLLTLVGVQCPLL